jgi:hypothetical protein
VLNKLHNGKAFLRYFFKKKKKRFAMSSSPPGLEKRISPPVLNFTTVPPPPTSKVPQSPKDGPPGLEHTRGDYRSNFLEATGYVVFALSTYRHIYIYYYTDQ